MDHMLRKLIVAAALAVISGLAAFWFLTEPETVPASELGPHTPNLANGKEMFYAGGCASCHAVPKQEDKTKLGGGLALGSPFGTFYIPNISSDPRDGIGGWSEAQFVTAMVKGTTPCRSRSISAARLAAGSGYFLTASHFNPIRRNRRNGTTAPIWSMGLAT